MSVKQENERIIQAFLFGEMSEEVRFEFEERFITDASLFEQIKAGEDDLIEEYVRGWMNPAKRSKFEQSFLTTNQRRERVEFSRQLIGKLEVEQTEEILAVKKNDETTSDESVSQKLSKLFLTPKLGMATAFALLLAVFGGWFLSQNLGGQEDEIVKNNNSNVSDSPTPTPEITPVKTPETNVNTNENIGKDLDNSKAKTPTPTPKVEDTETPTPTRTPIARTAPNPVLALFPGTTRSGGKSKVLNLPKEAKAATLQLNLESVDYRIFQAQLTDANGNVVFQRGNLKARNSRIDFNIPAKNLKRGDYIIKLNGKNDSSENESVADFQFRVQQ